MFLMHFRETLDRIRQLFGIFGYLELFEWIG